MPTPAELRWEPIVRKARRSGLSLRDYARKHNINEHSLANWHTRLADRIADACAADAVFVEVTVTQVAAAEPAAALRLQLGRVCVEVDQRSDLALLRQVVEALS